MALEQPAIRRAVIDTAVRESQIIKRIPFENSGSLSLTAPYLTGLGAVGLRHINEAAAESSSTWAQITHAQSIFEAYIDIDPVILMQKNTVQNFQVAQSRGAVRGMMYEATDQYINGDPLDNSREFPGIRAQLDREPRFSGQTINASANATEVNILVGTGTDANYLLFLHKINQLLAMVNLGSGQLADDNGRAMIISNWNVMLTVEAALRQLKLFATTRDSYEREVMSYKGIEFYDAGWTRAGAVDGVYPAGGAAGDLVIGNDSEAVSAANGGNTYDKQTPIYIIRLGSDYNMGLQLAPMSVKNLGETQTSPHYNRTMVRWVMNSAALWQKRAAARLVGYNFSGVTS